MPKKSDTSTKDRSLRELAEELLQTTTREVAALQIQDVQQLVHELQVHQIELEMQNEELRRSHLALEAAKDRYVDLYDFSPAGLLTLDLSGTIVEANLRAATLLDVNRQALVGQPLLCFLDPEHQPLFKRHCQEVLKTGTWHTCEVQLQKASGHSCWVYLESLAIPEGSGRITQWRTALLDISSRKRAEQEKTRLIGDLARSQQHFHTLFNWTPSAVGISTVAEDRLIDVNEGFSRLTGYQREDVLGRTTLDMGLWADPSEREAVLRDIQAHGRLHNREGRLRTKSGEIRTLMVSVESIQLEGIPCLIYLAHDITERKLAEEALRLAKFTVDRAADAVYWIDPQAKILDVNEAASLMLGYSRDELCAMTVHDLNPDFRAGMWPGLWAETQQRGTMVFETVHRAKNGRRIPIEVSVNYLFYEGKEYHCAFVRDITERKRVEEALRRSQTFITSVVENLPNMIFVKDAKDLKFVRVNKAGEDLLGHSRDVLIGKSDYDFSPKEEADFFTAIDRQVLKTGSLLDIPEEPIETKDQERRILHTKKIPICDDTGEPQYLLGISEDITDRKRTEDALRKSEERYRSIFENAVEGIFQTTFDGKYVAVNPALAHMYGYDSPEDMLATVTDIASQVYVDPGRRDEFIRLMQQQEEVTGFEALVYRRKGGFIWISENVRALHDTAGMLVGYEGTVENITERKLVEKRLQDTLDQVRMLSGRVATVQEEERSRIARELHDELGVGLTCLKIDLSRLQTIMSEGGRANARKKVGDKIRSMNEQINSTIVSVQRLVTELRPAILDDLGLVAAIEWQCTDFQKRTGILCTCVASADDIAIKPERATALFRICQEALTNTARHAQATAVTIKLESRSDCAELVVADNGVGISDAELADRRSLGLLGMKERVTLFGGEITIRSLPGKGTTVTACLRRH